jgi:hypothetical protein
MPSLQDFVAESNRIEGIQRDPTKNEIAAHERFLETRVLGVALLEVFVSRVAKARLRDTDGMDVVVGLHVPPAGGSGVSTALERILEAVEVGDLTPWEAHVAYETLHPFMDGNGRSGRVLWAWQMERDGLGAFALPALHRMYYQALEASGERTATNV